MTDKEIDIHVTFSTSLNHKHKAFGSFKYSDPVKYYYYKNFKNSTNNKNLTSYLECPLNYKNNGNDTESIPNIIHNFIDLGDDPSFLGYYLTGCFSWGVCDTKSRNAISLDFNKNKNKDVYIIFISIKSKINGESLDHFYYYCGYAKISKIISHFDLHDSSFKYHSNKLLSCIKNSNNFKFNEWSHDIRDFYNGKFNFSDKKIKFNNTIHHDWINRAGITPKDNGEIHLSNNNLQFIRNCNCLRNYIVFDNKNTNILTNPINLNGYANDKFHLLSHLCLNMKRGSCSELKNSQYNNDLIKTFKGQGKGGMHTRHKLKFDNNKAACNWLKELHNQIHGIKNENNLLPLAGN